LGGGLGLIASGHALAAVGGSGMLEVDLNENPLRTELISDLLKLKNGTATLGTLPGLGIEPNLSKIARYKV
jgi:D-galactarolactone cycloisomerase